MNKEARTEWYAALRSDEFEQGWNELKYERTQGKFAYCCLGVLLELFPVIRKVDNKELLNRNDASYYVGLTYTQQKVLAKMNDDGSSFTAIADYIEEKL